MPAFSFAGDIGVLIAEYGRHIEGELPRGEPERLSRAVWHVPITLERSLDLRDPGVIDSLGLPVIEGWIADRHRTQATVRFIRHHVDVQGLIVPPMSFLDDPARWNAVVYLDRVDPRTAFDTPKFVRHLVLSALGDAS